MTLHGRCLCGQVTYVIEGLPLTTLVCHCRNCQRQGASAFSINLVAPSEAVRFSGRLKSYADTGASGRILDRKFCPDCGSPIVSVPHDNPEISVIKAGTLDDVEAIRPQSHVWCNSAQPWISIDPNLPRFAENYPGKRSGHGPSEF